MTGIDGNGLALKPLGQAVRLAAGVDRNRRSRWFGRSRRLCRRLPGRRRLYRRFGRGLTVLVGTPLTPLFNLTGLIVYVDDDTA